MKKTITIMVCAAVVWLICDCLLWAYRPGGPMNPHDWVTDHFKKPEPCPPPDTSKSTAPGDAGLTFNYCGNQHVSLLDIGVSASMTKDGKPINVQVDYCLKHGEWRTIK